MQQSYPVLGLSVRNHPGVMSQICGLLARRTFNVRGIVCLPSTNGTHSHVWLQLETGSHLEQVIKQLRKLEDVFCVIKTEPDCTTFDRLPGIFEQSRGVSGV